MSYRNPRAFALMPKGMDFSFELFDTYNTTGAIVFEAVFTTRMGDEKSSTFFRMTLDTQPSVFSFGITLDC